LLIEDSLSTTSGLGVMSMPSRDMNLNRQKVLEVCQFRVAGR